MQATLRKSLGRPWAVLLSCLLLASGCSTAHIEDPHHTWLPLTHRVYDGHDCCSDNCDMNPGIPQCQSGQQQFSAMEAELLLPFAFLADALTIPGHALGHLFARSEAPAVAAPSAPMPPP
jgi:hypothetical protein